MTSGELKYITLSEFKLGSVRPEEIGSYYGEYGVSGTSSAKYTDIRIKAYALYQSRSSISYEGFKQLKIKAGTNSKLEIKDIDAIRCDGLVEYCYEYYDVKLLGATLWNITTRSYHPNTHDTVGINPISQRNSMNFISKS